MKFVLESVSKCSGRLGVFTNIERLPDRTFKTPLLLYLNPQLSREVKIKNCETTFGRSARLCKELKIPSFALILIKMRNGKSFYQFYFITTLVADAINSIRDKLMILARS